MKLFKRTDLFNAPAGSAYKRFNTANKPSAVVFKILFDSILFKTEVEDSASATMPGHVLRASNDQIKARTNTSGQTVVADVTQLPGLILGATTGYTQHGSDAKKDGIKMSEWTNDTTGAKDFMIDFLASSTYFTFDETTKELLPKGTIGEGKYWGTAVGSSEIGFHDMSALSSNKVLVSGASTADYLNTNQFQYVDSNVHVALKLSANKIWVGVDAGDYETVSEVSTNTAFNKAFGFTSSDIVEIASSLAASSVLMTDVNKKLVTFTANTGFNLNVGTASGTVAAGDHSHSSFGLTTDGYVPAPGSVAGKVLSDDGTWVAMQTASDTYQVKGSSSDATPGFLDAKVDNDTIGVTNNKLYVKNNGIGLDELDLYTLQYVEVELDHSQIIQLNSNPVTIITCPTVAGYDVKIIVETATLFFNYTNVYYQTNTNLSLQNTTGSLGHCSEDSVLTSTVDREVYMKKAHIDDATETQIKANEDLVLTVTGGNPSPNGVQTTAGLRIRVWYRIAADRQPE